MQAKGVFRHLCNGKNGELEIQSRFESGWQEPNHWSQYLVPPSVYTSRRLDSRVEQDSGTPVWHVSISLGPHLIHQYIHF